MSRPAIIESIHDHAVREINALERRIVAAEDDADAKLWEQAQLVVAQLEAGLTQRALAKEWINARTGESYTQAHVSFVKQTVDKFTNQNPRPRFRDAYNEIANRGNVTAHVSHNSGENEWYSPKEIVDAARLVLGGFDLDPASSEVANEVIGAKRFFDVSRDGLKQAWRGRVWMNPPYAQPLVTQFCEKFAHHVKAGDVTAGIALVNNATETEWFGKLAGCADAMCFPSSRVRFWHPDRETCAPLQGQAVVYAGNDATAFCRIYAEQGIVVKVVRR